MARRILLVLLAAMAALGAGGQPATTTTAGPQAPLKDVPFHVQRNVRYGTAGGQELLLDAYVPEDTNAERVSVMMLHGGAWRTGDKGDVVEEASRLARRGWVVFAPNYRLSVPEAFPAQIEDVQAAVDWARLHAYDYRMDPGRMAAFGFSAGGHLAAMLATLGEGPPDRDGRVLVAASWSGPMDLTALGNGELAGLTALLLPCPPSECPRRWQDASPISQVDETDAPIFLANSTDELVPVEQARAMASRLNAAGVGNQLVIVPGSRHGHGLRDDVWPATVAFLDHYLTRPTDLRTANPVWGTVVLLVVIGVVVVGGLIGGLRVRRRLNADHSEDPVTEEVAG